MTPQEEAERLLRKMHEVSEKSQILGDRYSGFMQLYKAACKENNQPEMNQTRQTIISLTEQILDHTAVTHMLARQLADVIGSANGGMPAK